MLFHHVSNCQSFISSQWMVLNYNMFTPGNAVVPETLWVLEQMPGMVQMADMSLYLIENGYWASYNIPYVLFFSPEIVEDLKTNCNMACSNIQYSDYLENALSTQPVGRLERLCSTCSLYFSYTFFDIIM